MICSCTAHVLSARCPSAVHVLSICCLSVAQLLSICCPLVVHMLSTPCPRGKNTPKFACPEVVLTSKKLFCTPKVVLNLFLTFRKLFLTRFCFKKPWKNKHFGAGEFVPNVLNPPKVVLNTPSPWGQNRLRRHIQRRDLEHSIGNRLRSPKIAFPAHEAKIDGRALLSPPAHPPE